MKLTRLALAGLAALGLAAGTAGAASASTGHATAPSAWCTTRAYPANDGWPGDYDIYVWSNQPHRDAVAADRTDRYGYPTNSHGFSDVYLWYQYNGELIKVTVGGATCWTRA